MKAAWRINTCSSEDKAGIEVWESSWLARATPRRAPQLFLQGVRVPLHESPYSPVQRAELSTKAFYIRLRHLLNHIETGWR